MIIEFVTVRGQDFQIVIESDSPIVKIFKLKSSEHDSFWSNCGEMLVHGDVDVDSVVETMGEKHGFLDTLELQQ